MANRNNPNRIKIHRLYTVIEVSETLGVHPRAVRNWIRAGLIVVDDKRPLLIHGADLKVYLKQKRKKLNPCGTMVGWLLSDLQKWIANRSNNLEGLF